MQSRSKKNNFEKDFFKLTNTLVFGKTIEDKLSEQSCVIEMNETKVKINKPIYSGLLILEIRKTVMYEFWYGYIKPKYQDKANLSYTDTDFKSDATYQIM